VDALAEFARINGALHKVVAACAVAPATVVAASLARAVRDAALSVMADRLSLTLSAVSPATVVAALLAGAVGLAVPIISVVIGSLRRKVLYSVIRHLQFVQVDNRAVVDRIRYLFFDSPDIREPVPSSGFGESGTVHCRSVAP